jgi:hypothetical protein
MRNNTDLDNDRSVSEPGRPVAMRNTSTRPGTENNQLFKALSNEGYLTFIYYMESLGLDIESDFIIIPRSNHFFYDEDEIRKLKLLVDLREMNKTRNMKSFIKSLGRNMQSGCFFAGCFSGNRSKETTAPEGNEQSNNRIGKDEQIETGIASKYPIINTLYNILDSKTYTSLSPKAVSALLNNNGFNIIDLTEINSIYYFCAKKV